MKVLLTNDDGITADGIEALYHALAKSGAEVTVVAPDSEKSAVGHAITIADPMRVKFYDKGNGFRGYAVSGTPADCVKIALKAIMTSQPDIVVSGVNLGPNVATNIIYSGTVSAATEAAIMGRPAIAVSLNTFMMPIWIGAAEFATRLAAKTAEKGLPAGVLLNVNVPNRDKDKIKGVKTCIQGKSVFEVEFTKRKDPRQQDYYWQGGTMGRHPADDSTDIGFLEKGYITVTPIQLDLTCHDFLPKVESWDMGKLMGD